MKYTINIGLEIQGDKRTATQSNLIEMIDNILLIAFNGLLIEEVDTRLIDGETGEKTLVATFIWLRADRCFQGWLLAVSRVCLQDCIAARDSEGFGYLVGDRTEPYGGAFNAEYFTSF